MEIDKAKIYSISEFVAFLNADLKWMKAKIVGEVGRGESWSNRAYVFHFKGRERWFNA